MKLIVGLGNPGKQYEKTRHNLGFMVAEQFLKDFTPVNNTSWDDDTKRKADVAVIEWQRRSHSSDQEIVEKVILAKPKTYMNNSGMAVQLLSKFYKIEPENIWVVYDDLDLPLGNMKIRLGGASAGHHGIDSIIQTLGTDKFWRFRLGIGMRKNTAVKVDTDGKAHPIGKEVMRNTEDFVLGKFSGPQWGKARELIHRASKAIQEGLEQNLDSAMNRYNTK
jgi:PTH1 family peptidyl-tRNA hydrolase